jgi:hypothetical protein
VCAVVGRIGWGLGEDALLWSSIFWVGVVAFWLLLGNGSVLCVPGILCNALATLTNGGKMPVYGQENVTGYAWVKGTQDSHLQFLCDQFYSYSIGDFLIFAGLASIFVYRVFLKRC